MMVMVYIGTTKLTVKCNTVHDWSFLLVAKLCDSSTHALNLKLATLIHMSPSVFILVL